GRGEGTTKPSRKDAPSGEGRASETLDAEGAANPATRAPSPQPSPAAAGEGALVIAGEGTRAAETKAEWDASAVGASDGELLQTIVQKWPAVLQAVRAESKNVEALLRSCVATTLDGATVTLACDGDFHTRELQKPENKRMVEAGVSQVAGRPCYVKCVVRDKRPEAAKPAPAGQPDAAKPDNDDPLVRAALRMLNARVLENN
ncbi:MAG: hypothetical protein ACHQ7M_13995, partial [Chloroflexota bacterium]